MRAHEVEQAWRRGDLSEALTGAYEAWLDERGAAQAQVVRAIAAAALERSAPLRARNRAAFHRAWLERANASADLVTSAWLAATLRQQLAVEADSFGLLRDDYAETKYRALFERLAALRARRWHPSIAAAMVELVVAAPYSAWSDDGADSIYGPMLELVVETGDVSHLPTLEGLLARPRAARATTRAYLARALPVTIAALRAVPVRVSAPAAWEALVPRPDSPAESRDGPALLEQVWREPERLEHRLVYADWLTERGDPRGEFITLQASDDAKAARRASALLREHKATWLGELDQVLTHVVFERGFLASCGLAQNAAATEQVWARAVNDPQLRTVRRLEKARGNPEHHAAFALSPMMSNLRALEIPTWSTFERLLAGPPRLIETLVLHRPPRPAHLAALAKSQALPKLSRLVVVGADRSLAKQLPPLKLHHLTVEVVGHRSQARF